ncbi:MAG: DUF3306 domain-containing protein [Halofilum sp. (in: g-proteobacteria)]
MTNRRPESDATSTDESLLHRWSRRKQAAREGSTAESAGASSGDRPSDDEERVDAATAEPPDTEAAETELPTDEDMPPLESLDAESDYSQFMSPRVSDSLRRMALRKLFGMSSFNIRDGLDDYDEDFTRYQSLGDTVTADMKYQARRQARLAEDAEAPAAEEPDAQAAETAEAPSEQGASADEQPAPTEPRSEDAQHVDEESNNELG